MVMVVVMMVYSGGENRTRKHHQKQRCGKNLFHGMNVTRPLPGEKRNQGRASREQTADEAHIPSDMRRNSARNRPKLTIAAYPLPIQRYKMLPPAVNVACNAGMFVSNTSTPLPSTWTTAAPAASPRIM